MSKKSNDKLYIIIPAYNEEENIEDVVVEWHNVVKKINKEYWAELFTMVSMLMFVEIGFMLYEADAFDRCQNAGSGS